MAAKYAPEKDYYAVLGVEPTASAGQISAAFRARLQVSHPERFDRHSQPEQWETANEILRELNAAYVILGEPQSRAEYDQQRSWQGKQPTPEGLSTGRANPGCASPWSGPFDEQWPTVEPRRGRLGARAKGIGRLVGLCLIVSCGLATYYWMSGNQLSWLGIAILLVVSCVAVPAVTVFIGSLSFAQDSLLLIVGGIIFFAITLQAVGPDSTTPPAVLFEAASDAPKKAVVVVNEQPQVEAHCGNDGAYPDAATRRLRDVASISHRGVGFNTTHWEFLQEFPYAKRANPTDRSPVTSYCMVETDGVHDAVWFQFLGDDLLCLGFTYSTELVNRHGGDTVLLDHSTARFGPPTFEDSSVTIWSFPQVDRTIRAGWDGSNWCLLITRDSIQAKVAASDGSNGVPPLPTVLGE